jgi:2-keto-4-pentenoate hydratase/2-oxohepta-3-ene-1,7-dioic acid hydratase in catechol pathway
MRFATVLIDNKPTVVAREGDATARTLAGIASMVDLIGMSQEAIREAMGVGVALEGDESAWRFLPPLTNPTKILAIGRNYMDHAREQGEEPPKKPLIFAKLPSSLLGHGSIIEWDPADATQVDYEAELAVVIGRETRLVNAERALDYVFGYTVANDVTARDLQRGDGQWTRAKGMDTFCPMGPWLVAAGDVPAPQGLAVRSEVNGEIRQDSNTSEMVFGVAAFIAYVSRAFTLYPGDILLTGTPAGVGMFRKPPALLKDGDRVAVEVEGIGRLESLCRELTFRAR